MIDALRRPIVWVLFLVSAAYWAVTPFVVPRRLIEFMDGLTIVTAGTVMVVYSKAIVGRLSSRNPTAFDLMIIGIAGGWMVNAVDRSVRLVARVVDNADLINHTFVGYLLLMMTTFASFHVVVRGVEKEGPWTTTKAWGTIAVAILGGVALGTLAVSLDRMFHVD